MSLGRGIFRGNPKLAISSMLEACEPPRKDGGTLKNTICFSESVHSALWPKGNKGGHSGRASPAAALLATEARQEAKGPVRKLEEKLRLEKDMWLPTVC